MDLEYNSKPTWTYPTYVFSVPFETGILRFGSLSKVIAHREQL